MSGLLERIGVELPIVHRRLRGLSDEMPTSEVQITLTEEAGGTRMQMRSSFRSRDDMEKLIEMGAAEGLEEAVGQMDAVLAGRSVR